MLGRCTRGRLQLWASEDVIIAPARTARRSECPRIESLACLVISALLLLLITATLPISATKQALISCLAGRFLFASPVPVRSKQTRPVRTWILRKVKHAK